MHIRKKLFFFTLVFIFFFSSTHAQDCLILLEKAREQLNIQREKALFYGVSLATKLEKKECVFPNLVSVYDELGSILWFANDKNKGIKILKEGLAILIEKKKDSLALESFSFYNKLFTFSKIIGDFNESEKYLELAERALDKSNTSLDGILNFLYRKAIYFQKKGNFEKSTTSIEQAKIICHSFENSSITNKDSVLVLLEITEAQTLKEEGKFKESTKKLTDLSYKLIGKDKESYINVMNELSAVDIEAGNYSDAEFFLIQNLKRQKVVKGLGEKKQLIKTLNNISNLYYRINSLSDAYKYLKKAEKTTEKLSDVTPYLLNNIGTIYLKEGKLDTAIYCLSRSVKEFEELYGGISPTYATSLGNLAGAYREKGEYGKALDYYMKVLDMDNVIYGKNHHLYASSLENIALLYMRIGNTTLGGKMLKNVTEIREKTLGKQHPLYMKSLNDLGVYYLLVDKRSEALDLFDRALGLEIRHMMSIFPTLTHNQRSAYFKTTRSRIQRFCSLVFTYEGDDSPFFEKALNHYINTKGILFYASEKLGKSIIESNSQRLKDMYKLWRSKKYTLAQSYMTPLEKRKRMGINIKRLEEECLVLEKELSIDLKSIFNENLKSYHTWKELAIELPDDESVTIDIIEYMKYNVKVEDHKIKQSFEENTEKYVAFMIDSDTSSLSPPVKMKDEHNYRRRYAYYKNALRFGMKDEESYHIFWKGIDKMINDNIKTIYLASDGIFYKMNPIIFYDNVKKRYMIERYNIVNVTSITDLKSKREENRFTTASIFSHPNFSTLDIDFALEPLLGTKIEAHDVEKILNAGRIKTVSYVGYNANESNIKKITSPNILHIATHGYFNEDPLGMHPLNDSGLYLSKDSRSTNDGILSAYEVMNISLDYTDLVVLSACETGRGTVQNGEGVFGLQRSLLVAGAKNVLLSLVKIDDKSTVKFMNLFYDNLIHTRDPQDSFFHAQKEFKEIESDPFQWGAFILVSKDLGVK